MCFHTSQTKKVVELENRFKVKISDESLVDYFNRPQYHMNGFSHPNMLVIPQEKSRVLAPAIWGIVPNDKTPEQIKPYFKESVSFGGGLNAQSEKLFNHFVYSDSILSKRCIIPVTGFYEPHDYKGKKYPFYISDKDENPLSLAGIYTVIGTYITFTILTKKASPLFERIHNLKKRQPVILDETLTNSWLSEDLNEKHIKEIVTLNYDETKLTTYTVSKELFSPKVDSNIPTIINKVEYHELDT